MRADLAAAGSNAPSVDSVRLELVKLLIAIGVPLSKGERDAALPTLWKTYQFHALVPDNMERLVDVGLVNRLRTMLINFAASNPPYSADVVRLITPSSGILNCSLTSTSLQRRSCGHG